jgi:23S rRNA (cytosine1962-C5)-methyltransferase
VREISLNKSGEQKLKSHQFELKAQDAADSLRSFTPGEWVRVRTPQVQSMYLGFVNPLLEDQPGAIQIIENSAGLDPKDLIQKKIQDAFDKRTLDSSYHSGCRAFYGQADGLPGLIADVYLNATLIQINTAGLDLYRDHIKSVFEKIWERTPYLLDNEKYREKEGLPKFSPIKLPQIEVMENTLRYDLSPAVIQKVGFYYDHRENRLFLKKLLQRITQVSTKGLDLFCYAGAWGMNALAGGVKHIDFVDQGDFGQEINRALNLNKFEGQGEFHRADVFKFLDQAHAAGKTYDLILCDPPAFAKSAHQKRSAIDGYAKLHRKVLKILSPKGLVVFSSCTHYVSSEEFQKTILEASYKENRSLGLIHCGLQGWDHPTSSTFDKSNYIKSFFYRLEN